MVVKSITAPIGMGVAERIGASPTLTAVFAVTTGILGAALARFVLDALNCREWWQRGFAIGVASHYRLWCRVWAPGAGVGSLRISVDGGAEDIFDVAETGWRNAWQWVLVNGRAGGSPLSLNPRTFNLAAGQRQIVIQAAEANTLLDEMIVSNDPLWAPGIDAHPPALTASALSTNRVGLAWTDNLNNEDGFILERSRDGTQFAPLATLPAGTTSYEDVGLASLTTYYYRVFGFNESDRTVYSNVATAQTLNSIDPLVPPAAPTNILVITSSLKRRVDISWTDLAENENGFVVERSADDLVFAPVLTVGANSTNAEDRVNRPGWYSYRVRAFNAAGSSLPSNTITVRVK
jgi:hypothetical protein